MPAASKPKPKLYNPRHPERTLLYQSVAEHYETWLNVKRKRPAIPPRFPLVRSG